MTQKIGQSPVSASAQDRLAEKRAEALRANLRRRKDQSAARDGQSDDQSADWQDDQKTTREGTTEE